MSLFTDTLIDKVRTEFSRFTKKSGKQAKETELPLIVGEYWKKIGEKLTGADSTPWSAAFISFVVEAAKPAGSFSYASGHWVYLRQAVLAQENGTAGTVYLLRRPEDYAPKVGDLVAKGRGSAIDFTYDDALSKANKPAPKKGKDDPRAYVSHCDVVMSVDLKKGILETIGGNVSNSVSKTMVLIDKSGKLVPRKEKNKKGVLVDRPWIGVMECIE